MAIDELQKRVLFVHRLVFGETSLADRLEDIAEEADEVYNFKNEQNLNEELGDLLAACFNLAEERGLNVEELILQNIAKMTRRHNSKHYENECNDDFTHNG